MVSINDLKNFSAASRSAADLLKSVESVSAAARLAQEASTSPLTKHLATEGAAARMARELSAASSVMEHANSFGAVARLAERLTASPLAEHVKVAEEQRRQFERFAMPAQQAHERAMKLLSDDNAFSKLSRQIEEQRRAIDAIDRTPIPEPRVLAPEIRMPPNPLWETNDRLASIEERFDRMEAIAVDGAKIATNLQASAVDFLIKFENAASDNQRATRRVAWLAALAVVIAVMMPLVQVLYTELWRAPRDAASMQSLLTNMERELSAMEETQREVGDKLTEAIAKSNGEVAPTLEEIRRLLATQAQQGATQEKETPGQ